MLRWQTSRICPMLIGREQEVALVEQFIAGDSPRVLLVSGEAGIGKSRMVAEAARSATQQRFCVIQGACFEPDRALPYAPFLDLLRDLARPGAVPAASHPAVKKVTSELGRLLPELADDLSTSVLAEGLEPEQHKKRVFFALFDLFAALGQLGPVLLIVEDLHWSDDTSLEFLSHLAHHLSEHPVRVILSYRDDESHPTLFHFAANLQRGRLANDLPLARLSASDVRTMTQAILGANDRASPGFLNALFRLSEGNPFFVEEILSSILGPEHRSASESIGKREDLDTFRIPRTVHDAIQQRVARLSGPSRQLLTQAAVAGHRFDFALLQELAHYSESELHALIRELIGQHLVVEETADQFAFRHALTREAVYLDLLARERRALHQKIGEVLEQLAGETPDGRSADLAYHFFQAGAWSKAMEYCGRAGEEALNRYAPLAAQEHFSRAIVAANKLAVPVPPRLHRRRAIAYETLGDFDRARDDYVRAVELARASGDRRGEWQALLDLSLLWASRDYARTGAYASEALEVARALDDPAALAHTLNRLGNWHANREEPREALRYHEESLAVFEQLGERRGIAETLDLLAMTHTLGANFVDGAAAYARAIPLLRSLDDRPRLVTSLTIWALHLGNYWSDTTLPARIDPDAAVRAGAEALTLARDSGSRAGEAFVLYELALLHGPRGEYARALEAAEAGLAIAEEIEHRQWIVGARDALGALHLDLLNLAVAQQHLRSTFALARETGSSNWIRLTASLLASCDIAQGDLARASDVLDEAIREDTPYVTIGQRRCWCARGELALAKGDPAQALQVADRLIASSAQPLGQRIPPRMGKLRGEALLALGRSAPAEETLLLARREASSLSLRPWLWRLDITLGRLYRAGGRRLAAGQSFAEARQTIEELAADLPDGSLRTAFRERALALLPPSRPPSAIRQSKAAFGGLTAREREVARRIATGKSNRAIARDLVVGERTIEGYVSNILAKLGFTSRAQIAAWAVEKGLVQREG